MIEFLESKNLDGSLIFDSHAHYDDSRFDAIRDDFLLTLNKKGVGAIVNCGCDYDSSLKTLEMAEKFDFVYGAVGIHPSNLESKTTLEQVKELSRHKKCVAIGEIGLDYYWVSDNKEEQIKFFEGQLQLANELDLPVIVHDREAHGDTLELLKKHKPKGVVHSFSGSVEMAEEILKLGMYLGIGGVITFKNAKKLPDVVKMLPLDRLLLETDAPYLTPVPYRSRTNHSEMIYLTAQKIAEIKHCETSQILDCAFENGKKLFGL